jgi:drug/metabolite transporter (DMT)-like permease
VAQEAETVTAETAKIRQSEAFAAAMLVAACLCWAAFFSLAKNWQEAARACPGGELTASLTLLGLRTVLALAIFAVWKPRLFLRPSGHELRVGLLLGTLNCLGNIFQVWGLASTTPALSGFFTSLASLWVPILAFFWLRLPVARAARVGIVLGVAGLGLLGIRQEQSWSIGFGDGLTVLSSLAFAFLILGLDRLGRTVSSARLTLLMITFTGLPTLFLAVGVALWQGELLPWLIWLGAIMRQPAVVRDVLLLTLLSTMLATHLMSTYQPRVSASRAALIYLLEPVFAAALSVWLGHDELSGRLVLGGALILSGNALVELPLWIRGLRGRIKGKSIPKAASSAN